MTISKLITVDDTIDISNTEAVNNTIVIAISQVTLVASGVTPLIP